MTAFNLQIWMSYKIIVATIYWVLSMHHKEFQNKDFIMVSHAVFIDTLQRINIIVTLCGLVNQDLELLSILPKVTQQQVTEPRIKHRSWVFLVTQDWRRIRGSKLQVLSLWASLSFIDHSSFKSLSSNYSFPIKTCNRRWQEVFSKHVTYNSY